MNLPSKILTDFFTPIVAAAAAITNNIFHDAEVLNTKWQNISKDKGIVISNAEWDFAPQTEELGIYDALLIIGFYWRVKSDDTTEREDEQEKCFELATAAANAIFADPTLGGRVCDCLLLRAVDGMDSSTSDSYAIINLPIILNPTGSRDFNLGEAK